MKVLWIEYAPLGKAAELIESTNAQSGTWIEATRRELQKISDCELAVACIASRDVKVWDEETQVTYYGVGKVKRLVGKRPRKNDIIEWKRIIDDYNPDVIMLWGLECANGISVVEASEGRIPVLVYVQGIMGRNTLYSLGQISFSEWFNNLDIFSLLKLTYIAKNEREQKKQVKFEKDLARNCDGLITDNDWANSYFRNIKSDVNLYHLPLAVSQVFQDECYQLNDDKKTIFTIDGRYPGKGLYQLIKAMRKVVEKFPSVQLFVPGSMPERKPRFIFESPYYTYIKKLIKKYSLQDNIIFCGRLGAEQMKEKLLGCSVFVMPSCFENHSSSLREAMYLGVPCVTTLVGGIDEYTRYGVDALTYRYGEVDVLADHIIKLLGDGCYAKKIGDNAYASIREKYSQDSLGTQLYNIYREVLQNE